MRTYKCDDHSLKLLASSCIMWFPDNFFLLVSLAWNQRRMWELCVIVVMSHESIGVVAFSLWELDLEQPFAAIEIVGVTCLVATKKLQPVWPCTKWGWLRRICEFSVIERDKPGIKLLGYTIHDPMHSVKILNSMHAHYPRTTLMQWRCSVLK